MPRTKKVTPKPKVTLKTESPKAVKTESPDTEIETETKTSVIDTAKRYRVGLAALFLALALATAAFVLYKTYFVAAYVNGEPINRVAVIRQLEKANGKTVLQQMITSKLILQEAKKRNIEFSQNDLDKEIKVIEDNLSQQGMTLDQALKAEGMTRAELNDQMKTQILLQKMVKTQTVTDKELEAYITANEAQLPPVESRDEKFSAQIKQQLVQQKQQEAIQKFVAELEKKAQIKHVIAY